MERGIGVEWKIGVVVGKGGGGQGTIWKRMKPAHLFLLFSIRFSHVYPVAHALPAQAKRPVSPICHAP
jgi:hypothetical protein